MLDYMKDGVNAIDLGVIEDAQYALSTVTLENGRKLKADVWRRPASHMGTYGGWRWECGSNHPSNYQELPVMFELAFRINAVIVEG